MQTGAALAIAAFALPAPAWAQAPPPPPTAAQVKACVQQADLKGQWSFDWKAVDIGPARHPRNAYERVGLRGEDDYGYPVHVVYVFNHRTMIDDEYWLTHDAQNRWWIAALCRPGDAR